MMGQRNVSYLITRYVQLTGKYLIEVRSVTKAGLVYGALWTF